MDSGARPRMPGWLEHLRQDAVYGFRQLAKYKTFTAVAVATLALGLGATTAIFTLVHATLIGALPYPDADRIVRIHDVRAHGQSTGGLVGVPRFFDLGQRNQSLESAAFFYFDTPTLVVGSSAPVSLAGVGVSGSFWKVLGVQPFLGRAITGQDDRVHAPEVAVISYPIWRRLFGGDPGVINRQATLDGKGATIVGVMPPGFEYPRKTEIWTPSHFDAAEWTWRGEGSRFVNVMARLKQNVTLAGAQRDLERVGAQLRREHPDTDANWQFGSETLRDFMYGTAKPALLVLMAASLFLLLIACINVANLLVSRATTRTREVAVRRALGASQARIVAQMLTENILLALLGGGIGLAAAFAAVHWFGSKLPGPLGRFPLTVSWSIVWFALAVSVFTGLLFGSVPAWQARRVDLNTSVKRGDARVGGAGVRSAFISLQVALSLVLLIGASLLAESLWKLIHAPLGFQPEHVLTFEIKLPWNEKPTVVKNFFDEAQRRIESLPGVAAVGQISKLPTLDWHARQSFDLDWRPRTQHGDAANVETRVISGRYLEAMRIPLLAGRAFTDADFDSKQTRILVNRQFVRQYAPDTNPIGRHLVDGATNLEIVGVINDIRGTAGSIAQPISAEVYFPANSGLVGRSFAVRSAIPPDQLTSTIREEIRRYDPTQAIRDVATLQDRLDESVAQPRFNMGLLTSFALIATILACVGIYGVVSYSTSQRSLEIGIRIALGATRGQISALFVGRALSAALIGLFAGGIAALFLARLLRSQLYGVAPDHALTFIVAALLLLIPTLFASLLPAMRAASLNAADTLRKE